MLDNDNVPVSPLQLPAVQHLANARRVLEINCEGHPFMDAEGRAAIRDAKRIAWATIAHVAEELTTTLDAAAGDPDLEDDDPREDDDPAEDDGTDACAAGDDLGTANGGGDDGQPGDANDAERETWAHWLDHPAELHVGKRPGWTE